MIRAGDVRRRPIGSKIHAAGHVARTERHRLAENPRLHAADRAQVCRSSEPVRTCSDNCNINHHALWPNAGVNAISGPEAGDLRSKTSWYRFSRRRPAEVQVKSLTVRSDSVRSLPSNARSS